MRRQFYLPPFILVFVCQFSFIHFVYVRIYNIYDIRNGVIEVELDTFVRKNSKENVPYNLEQFACGMYNLAKHENVHRKAKRWQEGSREYLLLIQLDNCFCAFIQAIYSQMLSVTIITQKNRAQNNCFPLVMISAHNTRCVPNRYY